MVKKFKAFKLFFYLFFLLYNTHLLIQCAPCHFLLELTPISMYKREK